MLLEKYTLHFSHILRDNVCHEKSVQTETGGARLGTKTTKDVSDPNFIFLRKGFLSNLKRQIHEEEKNLTLFSHYCIFIILTL